MLSTTTDAELLVTGTFQLRDFIDLGFHGIGLTDGNGLLKVPNLLDQGVQIFVERINEFGLGVTRQLFGPGRREGSGLLGVTEHIGHETQRGRFLGGVSVLPANETEAVVHCFHFDVKRGFRLFRREGVPRHKQWGQ